MFASSFESYRHSWFGEITFKHHFCLDWKDHELTDKQLGKFITCSLLQLDIFLVPLSEDEEEWMTAHGLPVEVASVLEALNPLS